MIAHLRSRVWLVWLLLAPFQQPDRGLYAPQASAEVTSGLDGVDQSAVGAKVADPNPETIPFVDELGRIVRCLFPELLRIGEHLI